eukprot:1160218-Pelagomonas_calceolata.AAC.17
MQPLEECSQGQEQNGRPHQVETHHGLKQAPSLSTVSAEPPRGNVSKLSAGLDGIPAKSCLMPGENNIHRASVKVLRIPN